MCRQKAVVFRISKLRFRGVRQVRGRYDVLRGEFVLAYILSLLAAVGVFLRSRTDTAIEVLALRQQVAVLKRKRPRPTLNSGDRLFWTTLRALSCRWADILVIVKPETVIGWHRAGFRLYRRWRSRPLAAGRESP